MTAAQIGTLSVLLASAVAVTAVIWAGGAALARLWFLARIEAIRDDAVDAILNGTPRRDPSVAAWLAEIDGMARSAQGLGPGHRQPGHRAAGRLAGTDINTHPPEPARGR